MQRFVLRLALLREALIWQEAFAIHVKVDSAQQPAKPVSNLRAAQQVDQAAFQAEASELGWQVAKGACLELSESPPWRSRPKPVVWIHIHKVAGSFICGMAHLNQEHIPPGEPGDNCNWKFRDDFKQIGQGFSINCEERHRGWQMNRTTWAQFERELNDEEFCPQYFDYAMAIRDPVSLAQSEINFRNFSVAQLEAGLKCVGDHMQKCNEPANDDGAQLWKFFDNYQVRILGGMATWSLPPGGVQRQHYDKALGRLAQFYRVFPLEALKDARVLETSFGWSTRQLAPKDPMGDWEKKFRNLDFKFSKGQARMVKRYSQWDVMLHEYALSRTKG